MMENLFLLLSDPPHQFLDNDSDNLAAYALLRAATALSLTTFHRTGNFAGNFHELTRKY